MSLVFFVSAMTNVTQGSLKSVKFLSPSLAPKKKKILLRCPIGAQYMYATMKIGLGDRYYLITR